MWGGISCRGATAVCIFEGITDRHLYTKILSRTLVPFIKKVYLYNHRFMQFNDPEHISLHARTFMMDNVIKWWPTPPESPDANPIENLWHTMKEFIRREVEPKNKTELVNGIKQFWRIVDRTKCIKYIYQTPKESFTQNNRSCGEATGY